MACGGGGGWISLVLSKTKVNRQSQKEIQHLKFLRGYLLNSLNKLQLSSK